MVLQYKKSNPDLQQASPYSSLVYAKCRGLHMNNFIEFFRFCAFRVSRTNFYSNRNFYEIFYREENYCHLGKLIKISES